MACGNLNLYYFSHSTSPETVKELTLFGADGSAFGGECFKTATFRTSHERRQAIASKDIVKSFSF